MNHFRDCLTKHPSCICNTCVHDHYPEKKDEKCSCCEYKEHRRKCDCKEPCPDYMGVKK